MKRTPTPRSGSAGFSLVELMVSITLGLLLLAGISTLLVHNSSARNELEKSMRQLENGRYAVELLSKDIHHAGYYGEYASPGAGPSSLPNPCATDTTSLATALPLPIQGYDALSHPLPSPLSTCLADANHLAGTDILVVRRAQTGDETDVSSAVANQIYIQSNSTSAVIGSGQDAAFNLTKLKVDDHGIYETAELHPYYVYIYFISPCDVPASGTNCTGSADDNGSPIPTLKRLELPTDGSGTMKIVPLVEGIENMQLDYGIDSDGDGTPDSFTATPATTDWANVTAIRVNLLARNTESSTGPVDAKQYNLGLAGNVGPMNDQYRRHVYSALVRAVNPSGRREQ